MTDLMGTVLGELRLESVAYRRLELDRPFRLSFDQAALRGVHVVLHGECELVRHDGTVTSLRTGDLVMLPRADPHILRSPGAGPLDTRPVARIATSSPAPHASSTVILCGAFLVGEVEHPALQGFPTLIHIPGQDGAVAPWLRPYLDALAAEARDGGPGSDIVMARLSDALIIRSFRHCADTLDQPGWLRGSHDAVLAPALRALHADLARSWTIAELAAVAGVSRATFAARFTERMGQPVIAYVLAARMQRARVLLRDQRATIAAIAHQVGYGSDIAFAAAFKRAHRVTPGAYRATSRTED
ncbi:AraC family transcriptional regulator [Nocardia lasii]|uniref:Cupin domain-containing protein n=1 Tax=Nocardia lasii TaxID=1616107 RepID=A0ABW1JQQ0_9NOCA